MIQTIIRTAILAAALASAALADSIVLTFTGPATGFAGSTVTLFASATNTSGAAQSLDGVSITLVSPFVTYDDSPFYANWPLSLDASGPGSQFGPAAIFEVVIPLGTPTGLYAGNVANLMGGGVLAPLLLASQTFEIEVGSDVPEPASICLVVCGIAALGISRRSRVNIENR